MKKQPKKSIPIVENGIKVGFETIYFTPAGDEILRLRTYLPFNGFSENKYLLNPAT
ncbi:MAG TPA: hypothetical protein VEA37_04255 [Flavobacterium sp.]|nr:hypothetical protein [Flavobacterium sp.]